MYQSKNVIQQKYIYNLHTSAYALLVPTTAAPTSPIIFSQPGGPRFRGTAIKAEAAQFSVTSPKLWNSKHITTAWVNPWPGGVVPSGWTTLGGKDSQFYSDKKHHPQIPQYDCRKSGL